MSIDNRNDANQAMEKLPRQGTGSTQVQTTSAISSHIAELKLDRTTDCVVVTDEPRMSISSDSHVEPAEHDNDLVSEHAKPSFSASRDSQPHVLAEKVRVKKRTMQENAQLQNAVLNLYQLGHPPEAIAIMCKVQLATVQKVIVNLLSIGKLPSCAPKYTILGGGKYVKDIISLSITKADYVSIIPTDDGGVILKPFNINGVDYEQ